MDVIAVKVLKGEPTRVSTENRTVPVEKMAIEVEVAVGVLDAVGLRVGVRVIVYWDVRVMVGERVIVGVLVIVAVAERAATVSALAVLVLAMMISTKPVGPARITPCCPCNMKYGNPNPIPHTIMRVKNTRYSLVFESPGIMAPPFLLHIPQMLLQPPYRKLLVK